LKAKHQIIYLCLLAILVIASYLLVLIPKKTGDDVPRAVFAKRERLTNSQLPQVKPMATFPTLSAQGVIAIDLDSSVVLYEKSPEKQLLPASTTKIMTALIALESFKLEDTITVGNINVVGQKMRLVPGERITVGSLLDGLLIFSANDAAEVLAANFPGGRSAFINQMNIKAKELSMENTHFSNPSGLDALDHYSSVQDLVRLSDIAMQNPIFAEIVSTKTKIVSSVDGKIVHPLKNINELLGEVEGVMGVKTGWTEGARENLVTYVIREPKVGTGKKRVLIALLGSQDRFGETKTLIDWIFNNLSWQDVGYSLTE
jgi:D-alanyl-D-alanine carboxypeptidase